MEPAQCYTLGVSDPQAMVYEVGEGDGEGGTAENSGKYASWVLEESMVEARIWN